MAATADFDPTDVGVPLTEERIHAIMIRRGESAKFDFKLEVDPSGTKDKVEIAKDLVAMANTAGGYILIGVADDGTHHGLTAEQLGRIDEATVRAQTQAYISTSLELFVENRVTWNGRQYCVFTVLPSPRSPIVFTRNGDYPLAATPSNSRKETKTVFAAGDVFVRHGSASERWNQADVEYMYKKVLEREREKWLAETIPVLKKAFFAASGEDVGPNPRELMLGDGETLDRMLSAILRQK